MVSNASNTREASIMHLELRSSMFAETCISKLMPEFQVGQKKKRRFSLEVLSKMEFVRIAFLR